MKILKLVNCCRAYDIYFGNDEFAFREKRGQRFKSGLISKKFVHPPKNVPNNYPEHLLFRWIVLRILIWHMFGG